MSLSTLAHTHAHTHAPLLQTCAVYDDARGVLFTGSNDGSVFVRKLEVTDPPAPGAPPQVCAIVCVLVFVCVPVCECACVSVCPPCSCLP